MLYDTCVTEGPQPCLAFASETWNSLQRKGFLSWALFSPHSYLPSSENKKRKNETTVLRNGMASIVWCLLLLSDSKILPQGL